MINFTAVYEKDGVEVKSRKRVPTKWEDVTFRQYCELISNTNPIFEDNLIKQIQILSGFTEEELGMMGVEFVERLGTMIAFSYRTEELEPYINSPKGFEDFKIGKQPYGKVVKIKQAYKRLKLSGANNFELSKTIVKEYLSKDIEEEPITEVIGTCTFFLTCFLPSLTGIPILETGSISKKKSKPGYMSSVKRMVTFLQLTPWRTATSSSGMKSMKRKRKKFS